MFQLIIERLLILWDRFGDKNITNIPIRRLAYFHLIWKSQALKAFYWGYLKSQYTPDKPGWFMFPTVFRHSKSIQNNTEFIMWCVKGSSWVKSWKYSYFKWSNILHSDGFKPMKNLIKIQKKAKRVLLPLHFTKVLCLGPLWNTFCTQPRILCSS